MNSSFLKMRRASVYSSIGKECSWILLFVFVLMSWRMGDLEACGLPVIDISGIVVAKAGDVNGDGYSDVVAGVPAIEPAEGFPNEGKACVLLGPDLSQRIDLRDPVSPTINGFFGASVASAGDVNGDGFVDVIVGAPRDGGLPRQADTRAFVFFGPEMTTHAVLNDPTPSQVRLFGYSVSSAGDINGDGFDDVVVGVPRCVGRKDYGEAIVFLGPSMSLSNVLRAPDTDGGHEDEPPDGGNTKTVLREFGFSVSFAGDVNRDGFDDVMVSSPGRKVDGQAKAGKTFVFFGPTLHSSIELTEPNPKKGTYFGIDISGAGDVNGDNFDDVIIGSPEQAVGKAYVFLGPELSTAIKLLDPNSKKSDHFGRSVSSLGDMNGDGYGDVVVGAPFATVKDMEDTGRAFAFLGPDLKERIVLNGKRTPPSRFGLFASGVGDVNGDGLADVVVGTAYHEINLHILVRGKLRLFLGPDLATRTSVNDLTFPVKNTNFGFWVSTAGDVNGDGHDDVIVGAPLEGRGKKKTAGAAFVFLGPGFAESITLREPNPSDQALFGYIVAGGRDLNGDGFGDVIVGAPHANVKKKVYAGEGFIFFGPDFLSVTRLRAPKKFPKACFGTALCAAGDINGDGFEDVAVGAPWDESGQNSNGKVFLFMGPDFGQVITLTKPTKKFGRSLSAAGDVNNDGFGDLIVGSPGARHNGDPVGKAFLFLGPALTQCMELSNPIEACKYCKFGRTVALLGDINGDGFDDVMVGSDTREATIFTGPDMSPLVTLQDTSQFKDCGRVPRIGRAVGSAGDFDGDGNLDVFAGSDEYGLVFLGPGFQDHLLVLNPQVDSSSCVQINQAGFGDDFGFNGGVAGDVNGDGFSDLILGSRFADLDNTPDAGRVYIYLGPDLSNFSVLVSPRFSGSL